MNKNSRAKLQIAIIGGGFGGIITAVKLKQAGFTDFVIYEQGEGPGGTWRTNTYPGCEVDIPSHLYSFSFMHWDWSRTHARQPEILAYTHAVIDHFALHEHFRFGTKVDRVVWDEPSSTYRIDIADGISVEYHAVVSAVGFLSVPKYPDWPGLDVFAGDVFHTARWDHSVDLAGKTVAVVGTGSTATQVVPAVADSAAQVHVFQREPGWINPKKDRDFSARERRFNRFPLIARTRRLKVSFDYWRRFKSYDATSRAQRRMRQEAESFIRASIVEPSLVEQVLPHYPWGCKRPVLSDTFYKALTRANVSLVASPVIQVTPDGVVDSTGARHQADVLVLSTGFRTTDYLHTLEVIGREGMPLRDAWKERPQAYLGVTIPGFPNFFVIYGPNTNGGGSVIAQEERQAEVVVWALKALVRKRATTVDTRPRALARWIRWIDHKLATDASAMQAGCTNYYRSASGENATQWPGTHLRYLMVTRFWRRRGLAVEGRGRRTVR